MSPMTDDAARERRDETADDLQSTRRRHEAALERANRAAIGSEEFRSAMAEVKRTEADVEQAERT
jgi:hypothetical protein